MRVQRRAHAEIWWVVGVVLVTVVVAAPAGAEEERPMDLSELVPTSIGSWRAEGEDGLYDRETIFRYMDGAGEIYLSFGFERLLVRRFTCGSGERITVELYDMGGAEDAYGIFTRNRQEEEVGVGQGSEYLAGYLFFWKGRCFVTVLTEEESEETRRGVFDLARSISERIGDGGPLPDIVGLLPPEGLIPQSIRYFHKHTDLNQHYFLSDDNLLDLDLGTRCVLGSYESKGGMAYLLIIRYPDTARAAAAHERYVATIMHAEGGTVAAELEGGSWTAASRSDEYVVAVFDAASSHAAEDLLSAALGRVAGTKR